MECRARSFKSRTRFLKKKETSAEIDARLISEKNALFQYRGIIFSGIVAAAPGFYNNLLCGASSEKLFYDAFIDFSFGATIHMMSAGIITMAGITCPISATTFLLTNLISLALNSLVDMFGVKEQLKSFV